MLLVILGAGASYDFRGQAGLNAHFNPPLTDGLVSGPASAEVLNRVPDGAAAGIVGTLARRVAHGEGLEQALDSMTTGESTTSRELVALRLYLQDYLATASRRSAELAGTTNHAELVRYLERWRAEVDPGGRVLYATFNYDTLMERALIGEFGWPSTRDPFDAYVEDDRWWLFKLHGSCNWAQMTTVVSPWEPSGPPRLVPDAKRLLLNAAAGDGVGLHGRHFVGSWDFDQPADWIHEDSMRQKFLNLPWIAIPQQSKATFACPDGHLSRLEAYLPAVDRILSIGWKGGEPHFLKLLGAVPSGCRLLSVNRSAAGRKRVATAIGGAVGSLAVDLSDETVYEHAFTSLLDDDRLDRFLRT